MVTMSIGRNIYYDWWHDFRAGTFDKWADKACVSLVTKSDVEVNGMKLYSPSHVFASMRQRERLERCAKKERPLLWFALIKFPDILEWLVHAPHSFCSTVYYYFYYLKNRFDCIDLNLDRNNWYDVDYKLERAVVVLFLDYVEKECGGLDAEHHGLIPQSKCKEYSKERRKQLCDLIEAYNFFRKDGDLDNIEEQINKLSKNEHDFLTDEEHRIRMDKFSKMDKKRDALREKYLEVIWNNRKYLWT